MGEYVFEYYKGKLNVEIISTRKKIPSSRWDLNPQPSMI